MQNTGKGKILNIDLSSDSESEVENNVPINRQLIFDNEKVQQQLIHLSSHKFNSNKITRNIFMNVDQEYQFVQQNTVEGKNTIRLNNLVQTQICKQKCQQVQQQLEIINYDWSKPKVQPRESSQKDEEQQIQIRNTRRVTKHLFQMDIDDQSQKEEGTKILQQKQITNSESEKVTKLDSKKVQKQVKLISPNQINKQTTLKDFARRNLMNDQKMQTVIVRKRDGLNFISPQFDLYFKKQSQYIISGKKAMGPKFQVYFSTNIIDINSKNQETFCGKLVGGLIEDTFNIFFNVNSRYMLICTAVMKQDNEGISLPRIYEVYCLKPIYSYLELVGVNQNEENAISIDKLYENPQNKDKIYYFRNKKPEYNKQLGAYFLNFKGRISKASVKNFILENPQNGNQIMMLGRNQNDTFNLQFHSPLSPFLALALALPHFYKL